MEADKEEGATYTLTTRTMSFPGTSILTADPLLSVLEQISGETSRNDIKKIIIHSGHVGNFSLLDLFRRNILAKDKEYVVFFAGYLREPVLLWGGHLPAPLPCRVVRMPQPVLH